MQGLWTHPRWTDRFFNYVEAADGLLMDHNRVPLSPEEAVEVRANLEAWRLFGETGDDSKLIGLGIMSDLSQRTEPKGAFEEPAELSSFDYVRMNDSLRSRVLLDPVDQRVLRGVTNDMRPLMTDRIVFRGVKDAQDLRPGDAATMRSPTSTSMSYLAASGQGFKTFVQMEVPAGTPAIVTNPQEREVLLTIGRRFQVVATTVDEHGAIVLIGDLE